MNIIAKIKYLFEKEGKIRYMRVFLSGCVLVGVFAVAYPYLLRWYTHSSAISQMGQYGDVYGGLNTLFTGLAFVGLIVTILQQRQEMKETREEFKEQTKQFEAQTRLLNEQIEEQKAFNNKQLQLAVDAQHRDELFKRLEIINNVRNEICLEEVYALDVKTGSVDYKTEYKGDSAMELLSEYCLDFFNAINARRDLEEIELLQLGAQQKAMYSAVSRLYAWLNCFSDYLVDVPQYFTQYPADVEKFYRLVFNSLSKYSVMVLMSFIGPVIDERNVLIAAKRGYVLLTDVYPIQTDVIAKSLLWEYVQKRITIKEARAKWNESLEERKSGYVTHDYCIRRDA